MGDSNIEWTDKTWNPVRGCSRTCASGTNAVFWVMFIPFCVLLMIAAVLDGIIASALAVLRHAREVVR